jgi:ribosome-associated protein
MDIRKLQRAIVDGLEDVKAHDIRVFNTEHLSPLFERVIVASGTSNRQTKALASSVRDRVKQRGMQVMRTEGESTGEWIIVDCGAAVVHVMQPAIRQYYNLEEIWGDKSVKMKMDGVAAAKASAAKKAAAPSRKPAAGKVVAKKAAVKKPPGKKAPAAKTSSRTAPKSAAKSTPKAAPSKKPMPRRKPA